MKKLVVEKEKLENNLNVIREKMCSINKDAKLIVVVKDNGMGLDIVKYSKFLEENKVDILATAVTEEAIEVKDAGIKTEVLMLTPIVEKDELRELIKRDVTLTVGSLYQANVIKEVLVELNKEKVNAHVKVDTGFARFGFMPNEVDSILKLYKEYDNEYFKNKVLQKLTKSFTISDFLELYYSFDYFKKTAIQNVFKISNYDDLIAFSETFDLFAMNLNNVIMSGVLLFDKEDVSNVIVKKYRLSKINNKVVRHMIVNLDKQ